MEIIKKWLKEWDFSRIFRFVLGVIMLIAYISTKETMYLVGTLFFGTTSLLNIGCPGNSCQTNIPSKNENEIIKTEEFKPKQ